MTGWFDPFLRADAWFDPIAVAEGWFDPEQIGAAGGTAPVTGTVAQSQKKQTQAVTALEKMIGAVAQAQDRQTQAATAAEAMIAAVAQSQPGQAQASAGIVLVAVTGTVGQAQPEQQQAATAVEAMLATVAQAQAQQAQAATAAEAMIGSVAQAQDRQQQAATGTVLANIVGQVAQAQARQQQQSDVVIPVSAPVVAVSGGQRGKRRGAEYGLVEYPVRGKRELTLALAQRRQSVAAEMETFASPGVEGELRPQQDIYADFEQKPGEWSAEIRQTAGLQQARGRFVARLRLAHRVMFGLAQSRQEFRATLFQYTPKDERMTPGWIRDILAREAVNERDDEEAILLLIASRR